MPRQHIAPMDIVRAYAVTLKIILVKVQQKKRQTAFCHSTDIGQLNLAHEDNTVHLMRLHQARHFTCPLCLLGDDFHHGRHVLFLALLQKVPIQGVVEGILIEKSVRHQDAHIFAFPYRVCVPAFPISQLLGCLLDSGTQLFAHTIFPCQPLGHRHHTDAQFLRDIRHPNRFRHVLLPW